jgi:CubicO group peptidase (beta-lactamase class C family)
MGTIMTRRFALLLLLATPSLLTAGKIRITPEKIAEIEQAVSSEMSRSTIPAVNLAIGIDTEVAWTNGFGMADVENMVPATSRTAIRLASISKPITAVAVMQLVENGKIKLDSPIQDYVPQFPQKQWPVTVRQLLSHLGGVRHYRDNEIESTRMYEDRVTPLQIFAADALLHEPGTKWSYTTYGYNLLGAAVELVSGMPFMEYLQANIFRTAGMTAIRDDSVYAIVPHRSRGYRLNSAGKLTNCGLADTSNKIPGGGLIAPAADLAKFAIAFNDGKLVNAGSAELMLTRQTARDGNGTPYGLGFMLGGYKGRRTASHGGGQQGASTFLMNFPIERIAIAVMMNREGAPVVALTERIAEIVFEP